MDIETIDLRDDTLTKPTRGMREAMMNAKVGDDGYGEDPTINELQDRCAKLFGMEAALFVPTGTMGNLIAVMCHCDGRGYEAIVGHKSHILMNEQGGIAQIAGVIPRTIHNLPDGTFSLDELKSLLRPRDDPRHPWTRLICLENTHNFCGGKVLPLQFLKQEHVRQSIETMKAIETMDSFIASKTKNDQAFRPGFHYQIQVYEFAKENDLYIHTDGARVMNAAVSLGVSISEILKYTDSVSLCFTKCLAAPVGTVLAGSKEFIAKALRVRKVLGGGMRQAGVLAAAALFSLEHIVPRLGEDHTAAKRIARAVMKVNSHVINIDIDGVHSNIITVEIVKPGLTAAEFCKRMETITEDEVKILKRRTAVKMGRIYPTVARIFTHNDLAADDVEHVIRKLQYVINEFSEK